MPGSFRIARIAGIDVYANLSLLIILVLLTVSLATSWFPTTYPGFSTSVYLTMGLISAVLLFVSVLLHELAHSFVARARGLPVKSIYLYIFGGVSNIEREPQSAGVEFQMAFVGPLTSLVIGVVSYLIFLAFRGERSAVAAIFGYLAISNVLLGLFNLVPAFPLDGGRVLRSIVWKITGSARTATNVATTVGIVFGYLFILGGIFLFFTGNGLNGLWIGFMGWFLLNAAQATRSQATLDSTFQGVTVGQIMNTQPTTVPANISLQRLVDEYFLPQGLRSAFVLHGDSLGGMIALSDIRHVPREQWSQTPVGSAMIPLEQLHVVTPQQSLAEALPLMTGKDVNQLPVVEDGRLVGVLMRDAILRSLEVRRSLNMDKAA